MTGLLKSPFHTFKFGTWIQDDPLPYLADLSEEQFLAVKWAFKRWVQVASHEGYKPITEWANFCNEVDHSSLLNLRLLAGYDALEEKPRTEYSYPVYDDLK